MSEMIVQCLVLITGERVEEEEDEDMEVVNGTWERGHRLVSATHTYPHICTYMALILCKLGQEGMAMLKHVSAPFTNIVETLKSNIYKRTCKCKVSYYPRIFRFLLHLPIHATNNWQQFYWNLIQNSIVSFNFEYCIPKY